VEDLGLGAKHIAKLTVYGKNWYYVHRGHLVVTLLSLVAWLFMRLHWV